MKRVLIAGKSAPFREAPRALLARSARRSIQFATKLLFWDPHIGRGADTCVGLARVDLEKIKHSAAYGWMTTNANGHGFNPYELEGWHWEYYVGE